MKTSDWLARAPRRRRDAKSSDQARFATLRPASLDRADVLGCRIDRVGFDEALAICERAIRSRRFAQHMSINAAKIVAMRADDTLRANIEQCELITADGQPVVWASKILHDPLPARVTGIDLMHALLTRATVAGYRIYILGAKPDVLGLAIARIRTDYPGITIVGSRDGYYEDGEESAVADAITAARPDILFVAMTSPRKEQFLARYGRDTGVPFVMGVGGAIDVIAGVRHRAPVALQRAGLEWAFRLAQEPGRLGPRYAVTNTKFVLLLARALAGRNAEEWARTPSPAAAQTTAPRPGMSMNEPDPSHASGAIRPADGSGSLPAPRRLTHLQILEAEAIHVMREVAARFERPVLLFSGGKDSVVLLRLAEKAFRPGPFPFPVMHVDTGHNFPEVIAFRDRRISELGERMLIATVQDSIERGRVREERGVGRSRNRLQTVTLLDAIAEERFDAAVGGARRDEERSRAKERIFSFRDQCGQWEPKFQRPEVWNLYNGRIAHGEHVRVFPLSNWTELDVWEYIGGEALEVPSIYFAHERRVFLRDGMLYAVNPFVALSPDERPMPAAVRYRTVGDMTCTGAVRSNALTVEDVLEELAAAEVTERGATRGDDRVTEAAMEDRKREGYF